MCCGGVGLAAWVVKEQRRKERKRERVDQYLAINERMHALELEVVADA
jgi:hypothetical protein